MIPENRDNLHHAYFCLVESREAGVDTLGEQLDRLLEKPRHTDPDFLLLTHDRMAIAHAHELRDMVSLQPFGTRLCMLSVGVILPEAQNTLLKLFEDPPHRTHFFVVSETDSFLLPTLRSRMSFIDARGESRIGENIEAFLSLPLSQKMEQAKEIAEEGTEAVRQFLTALEHTLTRDVKKHASLLQKIIYGKQFLLLPSASRKQILESIALEL